MNRKTKTASLLLLFVAVFFGIYRLYNRLSFFAIVANVNYILSTAVSVLPLFLLPVACVLLLLCILKEKEGLRKIAYVCLIAAGLITAAYLVYRRKYYPSVNVICGLAGAAVQTAAGILLLVSAKKWNKGSGIAVGILAAALLVLGRVSNSSNLTQVLFLAAGILVNAESGKTAGFEKITEDLTELKNQYEAKHLTEEEYRKKKAEVLSRLH